MGGMFSTTYDVQKVGHNVKSVNKKRSHHITHEIKTTETGNNVFAKSDIEIIGATKEINNVKKEDAKTVRIDESKTEIFEHVEVRQEPVPQLSEEERKIQEDLMIATIRGQLEPRGSISITNVSTNREIPKTEVENATTSTICDNNVNAINVLEEEPEKSNLENQIDNLNAVQFENLLKSVENEAVENIYVESTQTEINQDSANTVCVHISQEQIDASTGEINSTQTITEEQLVNDTVAVETSNSQDVTIEHTTEKSVEDLNDALHMEETAEDVMLREIIKIETEAKALMEKVNSAQITNEEYNVLQEEFIQKIIPLDYMSSNNDKIRSERKRVIKFIQSYLDKLEQQIVQSNEEEDDELPLENMQIVSSTQHTRESIQEKPLPEGIDETHNEKLDLEEKTEKQEEKLVVSPEEETNKQETDRITTQPPDQNKEVIETDESIKKEAEIKEISETNKPVEDEKTIMKDQLEQSVEQIKLKKDTDTVKVEETEKPISTEIKETKEETIVSVESVKVEQNTLKEIINHERVEDSKESIQNVAVIEKQEPGDEKDKLINNEVKALIKDDENLSNKEEGKSEETSKNVVEKPEDTVLRDIKNIEDDIRALKENVINYSSTTKDKEYETLHEAIVKIIIKLDDIALNNEEVKNEKKRVIKISQQCLQNLERKIETVKNVNDESESE